MLEFFLERFELDSEAWNLIFYTGREPIMPALDQLHTNVRIIKSRPDLESILPNIIFGIESKQGLPETYTSPEAWRRKQLLQVVMDTGKSSTEVAAALRNLAIRYGLNFTQMCKEIAFGAGMPLPESLKAQLRESLRGLRPSRPSKSPGHSANDTGLSSWSCG